MDGRSGAGPRPVSLSQAEARPFRPVDSSVLDTRKPRTTRRLPARCARRGRGFSATVPMNRCNNTRRAAVALPAVLHPLMQIPDSVRQTRGVRTVRTDRTRSPAPRPVLAASGLRPGRHTLPLRLARRPIPRSCRLAQPRRIRLRRPSSRTSPGSDPSTETSGRPVKESRPGRIPRPRSTPTTRQHVVVSPLFSTYFRAPGDAYCTISSIQSEKLALSVTWPASRLSIRKSTRCFWTSRPYNTSATVALG